MDTKMHSFALNILGCTFCGYAWSKSGTAAVGGDWERVFVIHSFIRWSLV